MHNFKSGKQTLKYWEGLISIGEEKLNRKFLKPKMQATKNIPPKIALSRNTTEERQERPSGKTEQNRVRGKNEGIMERVVVISLAISLDNIRRCAGPSTTEEIIKLIHKTNFNLVTFKEMVKTSADCKHISVELIQRFKE